MSTLTDGTLADFRRLSDRYKAATGSEEAWLAHQLAVQVPKLLGEVERLRAEVARLDADIAAERDMIAAEGYRRGWNEALGMSRAAVAGDSTDAP